MNNKKMARHALLAAGLAATGLAQAADSGSKVEMYGIVDVGVVVSNTGQEGAGTTVGVSSGNQVGTRWGLRGTERLNEDLSVFFNLEAGWNTETGKIITYGEAEGTFWGRRAVLGLQSKTYGEFSFGRDYTPVFWTVIQTDRFRYGLPGTVSTASAVAQTRANNGIFYNSPSFGGAIFRLAYAFGPTEKNFDLPSDVGHMMAASVDYRSGNLFISMAVQNRRDSVPGDLSRTKNFLQWGGGAEYSFDPYVVTAGFWRTSPVTETVDAVDRTTAFWLGAGVKALGGQINAQVARTNVNVIGRGKGHATTYGVSYTYDLSKRTALYGAFGGVVNSDNARVQLNTGSNRLGGTEFGSNPRALVVGMRHSF